MQQLTNTKDLLDIAKSQEATPPPAQLRWHRAKSDPARAWLRLDEVSIPEIAPVRQSIGSQAKSALDLLRSRILRQIRKEGIRKLGLCGVAPNSGTTSIAARLAFSLARQVDLKVMIFDLNLAVPRLGNQFAIAGPLPLQTALATSRLA